MVDNGNTEESAAAGDATRAEGDGRRVEGETVTEVFQDGFGTRTLALDHESGDAVEVLSFAPELLAIPDFGSAVGERVARLSRVRHTLYARSRRLDRPSEDALLLYSDRIHGWRLADVLAGAEREKLALDISTVLALLRQLIPAVALFSRHQRDATIGTIGPERLILTPQGRLVLAEYVLAPGVEQLLYTRERLWRELRVALPHLSSPSRIPPSADVVGIGVVAVSLLLGRIIGEDEFLTSLSEIVESLTESSAGTTRNLTPGFSTWIARALQLDENTGFQSTQEAQISFEEMLARERSYVTSSAQLDLFIARFEQIAGPPVASPLPRIVPEPVRQSAPEPEPTPEPEQSVEQRHAPEQSQALEQSEAVGQPPASEEAASVEATETVEVAEAEPDSIAEPQWAAEPAAPFDPPIIAPAPPLAAGMLQRMTTPFGAAAGVALVEAGVIAWLLASGGGATAGQIVIRSQPAGARVIIDAEDRGATPLTTNISAGTHTIGIRVGSAERFLPVVIQPGAQTEMYLELANITTASAPAAKTVATEKK